MSLMQQILVGPYYIIWTTDEDPAQYTFGIRIIVTFTIANSADFMSGRGYDDSFVKASIPYMSFDELYSWTINHSPNYFYFGSGNLDTTRVNVDNFPPPTTSAIDVRVVNTPLSVAVAGTADVNVTNSPLVVSVSGTASVTGSVTVSNIVNVNVVAFQVPVALDVPPFGIPVNLRSLYGGPTVPQLYLDLNTNVLPITTPVGHSLRVDLTDFRGSPIPAAGIPVSFPANNDMNIAAVGGRPVSTSLGMLPTMISAIDNFSTSVPTILTGYLPTWIDGHHISLTEPNLQLPIQWRNTATGGPPDVMMCAENNGLQGGYFRLQSAQYGSPDTIRLFVSNQLPPPPEEAGRHTAIQMDEEVQTEPAAGQTNETLRLSQLSLASGASDSYLFPESDTDS